MERNIHAGMRVLYKQGNSNWMIGTIMEGNAEINTSGIYIPIIPKGQTAEEEIHYTELNNLFTDAVQLNDWVKDYKEYYMTKEEYIQFIESEDFNKALENAYMTDGEYMYYPVSKYTKTWIEKQPFDYITRVC